ncbi:hypothetical protein C8R45DRAFT_417454 [Mycena sanguinolenta]|nr:hypothetical protein C8R45DRAFT_417454 [Mycena sanguinolenta]
MTPTPSSSYGGISSVMYLFCPINLEYRHRPSGRILYSRQTHPIQPVSILRTVISVDSTRFLLLSPSSRLSSSGPCPPPFSCRTLGIPRVALRTPSIAPLHWGPCRHTSYGWNDEKGRVYAPPALPSFELRGVYGVNTVKGRAEASSPLPMASPRPCTAPPPALVPSLYCLRLGTRRSAAQAALGQACITPRCAFRPRIWRRSPCRHRCAAH